ncbi:MAG: cardiolipin synthase [Pseudomonadota bacterium]
MSEYCTGNQLRLLCNGGEYFPALIAAIERAEFSVFLESYICAADGSGRAVAKALMDAAQRGVSVYVIVDAFGTRHYFGKQLPRQMLDAGVQLVHYRPSNPVGYFRRTQLRRLHRKLVLVDATVGFVGGINIIDDMNSPVLKPPRVDFAVEVRGPVLADFAITAQRLWQVLRVSNPQLGPAARLLSTYPATGNQIAQLVLRDNLRNRRSIENAYQSAISGARQEVLIATAYFFPGLRMRRLLMQAALSGVRVRLLLQEKIEYRLLTHATKALYGQLLETGIEVYEYHASFLHAKVAVVDGLWATVGSSNIDPLSLLMAREANLCVRDMAFVDELKTRIESLIMSGAKQVTLVDWQSRSLLTRLRHWAAYNWARFLIGVFAYDGFGWLEGNRRHTPLQ